jgi:hypothetical protein
VVRVSTPVPPPGLYSQPPVGLPPYLASRPVEAADPAVLTDGQVVPRQVVPAPAGGGAFSVDVERAPQVLNDLENARRELVVLRKDALRLGQVNPSSNDQVSHDAATLLGAVAVGGTGSLVEALDGGIERLGHLIDAISAELASYSGTEQTNRALLDRA